MILYNNMDFGIDNTSIAVIAIIFVSLAITSYLFLKKKDMYLTVVDKQEVGNGFAIVTFLCPKDRKIKVKPGQSFILKYKYRRK